LRLETEIVSNAGADRLTKVFEQLRLDAEASGLKSQALTFEPIVESELGFGQDCLRWAQAFGLDQPGKVILEIGARQNEGFGWNYRPIFGAAKYVGTDVFAGPGVDVVVDAHELLAVFAPESFDAVLSHATFEHLKKPWVVADQVYGVLKPGGSFLVETHFCFPVHGYPDDYHRWTRSGLEALLERFSRVASWYKYRSFLFGNTAAVWKNVAAVAVR
jgi:SAM-dependent methyltransferase